MTWEIGALIVLGAALVTGFTWYERSHPTSRMLRARRDARRARRARADRVRPAAERQADDRHRADRRLRARRGARLRRRRDRRARVEPRLRAGPVDAVADGRLGALRRPRRAARAPTGHRMGRVPLALACGAAGLGFGVIMDASMWVTYGAGQQTLSQFLGDLGDLAPVQHRARRRERRLLPRVRPGARAHAAALPLTTRGALGRPAPSTRPALAGPLALLLALVVAGSAALAGRPGRPARGRGRRPSAAGWLARAQNADGGWGAAPGARSNPVQTAWSVIGLAASGRRVSRVSARGRSPLRLLRAQAAGRADRRRPAAQRARARRGGPVAPDRWCVRSPAPRAAA